MSITDITGSLGVLILLLAFFLNVINRIKKEDLLYISMNIIGAGLACIASVMLKYMPFIILEGIWAMVSIYALIKKISPSQNHS